MGMPATTDRYWTPADLAQFPEGDGCRYECIDGELLVTPAPRFDRGHASQCLPLAISAALGAPKRVFYGLLDLRSEPMAVVEPDLVVFRDPMSRRARLDDMAGVSVLVEVLSPSTTKRDQARPSATGGSSAGYIHGPAWPSTGSSTSTAAWWNPGVRAVWAPRCCTTRSGGLTM